MMNWSYDGDMDALYLGFAEAPIASQREMAGVVADLDVQGTVVGVEIPAPAWSVLEALTLLLTTDQDAAVQAVLEPGIERTQDAPPPPVVDTAARRNRSGLVRRAAAV
jgi:uncharacterized protein YuzE